MNFFSIVSALIVIAAISSYINYRYIRLPMAIGVMLVALLVSLALVLAAPYDGWFGKQAAILVSRIDFNEVVLHGMLGFLLFAGAMQVKLVDLIREWLPISVLAVFGTLASTVMVGGMTWLLLDWLGIGIPFLHALLFGALISPTDPVAVLGIMRSVGAPRQIEAQVAGESLFNDGLGVAIFLVLLELSGSGGGNGAGIAAPFSIGAGASAVGLLLLKELGGALVLGLAAGMAVHQMLKRVDHYQVEVLITLGLAMGLYALADALHLSAPIAVVIAGLLVGNRSRAAAMSEKTREQVDAFWELVDEILNVVLFLLIGLELLVLPVERGWLVAGLLAIPIVLAARWFSVAAIIGMLGAVTTQSKGTIPILTWGGLRGGICVAMALSLPAADSPSLVLTLTYFVVVFSILVQGLTLGWLIRTRAAVAATPNRPVTQG